MTPSLEGWPTKAKEAPSPHEVRLAPVDPNPVFQCLGEKGLVLFLFRVSFDLFYVTKEKILTLKKFHKRFWAREIFKKRGAYGLNNNLVNELWE